MATTESKAAGKAGGRPGPLALGSFPEYAALRDRLAELRQREADLKARIGELAKQLGARKATITERALALLRGKPAAAQGAFTVQGVAQEHDDARAELVAVRAALAEGDKRLVQMAGQLAAKAAAPLRGEHERIVHGLKTHLLAVAELYRAEQSLLEALESEGIPAAGVCPCGPARPSWCNPGRIGGWVQSAMDAGYLPRSPELIAAAAEE